MNSLIIAAVIPSLLAAGLGAKTYFLNNERETLQQQLKTSELRVSHCESARENLISTIGQQNDAVMQLKKTNTVLTVRARKASRQAQARLKKWQTQINTGSGHEDLNKWLNGLLQ